MNEFKFQEYLDKVIKCPRIEENILNSPCSKIIKGENDWINLLGWGNRNAKIAFVGINPRYDSKDTFHKKPVGISILDHAKTLSSLSHIARHFRYHMTILEMVLKNSKYPKTITKNNLKDFAFFTEVVLCPTENQNCVNEHIAKKCFENNVKDFIINSDFKIIIILGIIATKICLSSFGIQSTESSMSKYHAKCFEFQNSDKIILPSYHPNARGKWDKLAIANTILDLCQKKKFDVENLFNFNQDIFVDN